MQQQEDRDRIRGEWMPCDDSDNRLEIAETDDPQLVALRDSYHHGRVIFATRSQVRNFARAVTGDDRIRDAVRALPALRKGRPRGIGGGPSCCAGAPGHAEGHDQVIPPCGEITARGRGECVVFDQVVRDTPEEQALWEAIVVPPEVKERLRNHSLLSMMLRPQVPFAMTGLHGLCTLYGPPGTGKTTLARGLPVQLARFVAGGEVRRIEVNPHGLMSAEHGQSQQRVSELLAEHVPALAGDGRPTVVVLDEVESMTVARSEASLAANPADVHRATDAVLTALVQPLVSSLLVAGVGDGYFW
jgi:hypothetical protein